MAPSRCRAPLQGAAAQNIARRLAVVGPMRSVSGFRSISRSSSSISTKVNTSAFPSISPGAIPTFNIPTPAPIALPIAAHAPTSTDDLFRQFMQAYMEDRWTPIPAQASVLVEHKEQLFKARFLDFYFGKLHLDCYRFCQQCEDQFDIARANEENCTPFAVFFLWDGISTR